MTDVIVPTAAAETPSAPVAPVVTPVAIADTPPALPAVDVQTTPVDAKPVPSAAPEKYEWKSPEGFEDRFDPSALEPIAKALGLKQEDAQALVDSYAGMVKADDAEREASWKQTQETWIAEVKADPKMGGANFEKTQSQINAVTTKWGTPELKEFFDSTGIGNNPVLARFLAGIGADMGQDKFVSGTADTSQSGTLADRMQFFKPSF